MGTIPADLESFKKNVEPNLSKMESTCSSIEDKIQTCLNAKKSAQDAFSSAYNSENKQVVMTRFDNVEQLFNKISSSVSSDLKGMLTGSKALIDLINELEDINKKIEEQTSIVNSGNKDTDEGRSKILDAREKIDELNSDFTKKCEEAKQQLTKLKAMDANLQFVSDFTSTDYLSKIDQLNGGSFEKMSFKASNGVVVNYYLWVPNYGEEVEGLPIHVYMHGSGETGDGVLNCGLPKMISEGTIVPEGMVVCLQASSGSDFTNKNYQQAVVELTQSLAEEHHGDTNKISVSGHSMGAIGGYSMINNYPGYFSAFVPISGRGSAGAGVQQVKVWAFHGANDSSVSYNGTVDTINQLKKLGSYAYLYTYKDQGHANVQNLTFQNEFVDPEGETINPLVWAFRQSKED